MDNQNPTKMINKSQNSNKPKKSSYVHSNTKKILKYYNKGKNY